MRVIYLSHSSGLGRHRGVRRDSTVLFAGGLLDAGRVPDIQDSQLDIAARLRVAGAAAVGHRARHGPVSPKSLVADDTHSRWLDSRMRELGEIGVSLLTCPRPASVGTPPGTSTTRSTGATPSIAYPAPSASCCSNREETAREDDPAPPPTASRAWRSRRRCTGRPGGQFNRLASATSSPEWDRLSARLSAGRIT